MDPIIQVAGIRSLEEANMLIKHGVEYLGFPLRLDVNQPDLSEQMAKEVIADIGQSCKTVLITYQDNVNEIIDFIDFLGVSCIQLHGPIDLHPLRKLRESKKQLFIIKSLVVGETEDAQLVVDLERYSPYVDAFITDTFDPETGAKGATGKTHDWAVSRKLVELATRPVISAGGLTDKNVSEAIMQVRPAGVDVHTGVEADDGSKDPKLVERFVTAAKAAF